VSGVAVPGTFTYTPGAGTVLGAGPSQALTVTFTPNDPTHFTIAVAMASIAVNRAPVTVTAGSGTKVLRHGRSGTQRHDGDRPDAG